MPRLILSVFLAISMLLPLSAAAQERVFIQIEAHPSLAVAQTRARDYAGRLTDVNGFSLGAGWYGIALGPFTPGDAPGVLQRLRAQGSIPRDSYVVLPPTLGNQFFPLGANALASAAQAAPAPAAEPDTPAPAAAPEPETAPAAPETAQPQPDETLAEARRSEAALTRTEREALQIALKWAGFYNAAIDGAFGRGTRGSMAAWQEQNGFEPTGVLTTRQRAELLRQYNAVLEGMGLRAMTDNGAGITMQIPTSVVAFDRYEYPFAHYASTGKIDGAQLLLISQPGDQSTLFGLYEIMQTLEIVPLDGPRERDSQRFRIEGANNRITSFTEARVVDGTVKGFTLVWPVGDEERRSRVLDEMRASFATTPGSIDPKYVDDEAQAVDLLAGLQVRTPIRGRSGVYIDANGTVLTVNDAVAGCGRITIDRDHDAQVVATDAALGLSILKPENTLAPLAVATLGDGTPRIQSEIAVSGYSFEGSLGAPTLTFGRVADIRGLRGEQELARLDLKPLAGDAGGPILNAAGQVIGVLLPAGGGARQLPVDVSFAAKASALQDLISGAGVSLKSAGPAAPIDPVTLTAQARDMTALVSCWE